MKDFRKHAVCRSVLALAAFFFTSTLVTFAHHSVFADFDRTQEKQYRATVSSFAWTNPHASFQARVDSAETATDWLFERSFYPATRGVSRVSTRIDMAVGFRFAESFRAGLLIASLPFLPST